MTTKSNLSLAEAGATQRTSLAYESINQAFPEVDAGLRPFGSRIVVQIRTPMRMTKSGFHLPEEVRETELWNTQVSKIIALGPIAFRNRDTLELWPEGAWVKPGAFVRCPKYGGDRWEVPVPDSVDAALFVLFNDLDLGGEITGDPLDMVAFIK